MMKWLVVFVFTFFGCVDVLWAQQVNISRSVLQFGDEIDWKEPEFDDSNWIPMPIKTSWEQQGFQKKDGFAWYRIWFDVAQIDTTLWYVLHAGRLDDADITYLNGREIGRNGSFPPNYQTAYYVFRTYYVHGSWLKAQKNLLSIRLFDDYLYGGWLEGDFRIEPISKHKQIILPLLGFWKFQKGDDLAWKEPFFDDADWDSLQSQINWELQGYAEWNGFAWYRKRIVLPKFLKETELDLFLGCIDDADQVFINGELIGQTGLFLENEVKYDKNDYKRERTYRIPSHMIESEAELQIAIRVYDGFQEGGLIKGQPVIQKVTKSENEVELTFFEQIFLWIWNWIKGLFV